MEYKRDKKKASELLEHGRRIGLFKSSPASEQPKPTNIREAKSHSEYLQELKPGSAAYGSAMTSPGNEEWKASQRKYPTNYSTRPNYPAKEKSPKKTLRDANKTYKTGSYDENMEAYIRALMQRLDEVTDERQKSAIRDEIKRARK